MQNKSKVDGILKKLDKQNERSFSFFESKNIQVRTLEGNFAFRDMETGLIYNAIQYHEKAIFILWITEFYEIETQSITHEEAQKLIDSGDWQLMANIQAVTATESFFREESKKLANENMKLKESLKERTYYNGKMDCRI